jgi:hypothetical protein
MVNQGAMAYLWAWYDGKVGNLAEGKSSGPFKIAFCSIEGATESEPLGEYNLSGDVNRIKFKKWHFKMPECESQHGNKIKYQLSKFKENITDVTWADQWASCDTFECHF